MPFQSSIKVFCYDFYTSCSWLWATAFCIPSDSSRSLPCLPYISSQSGDPVMRRCDCDTSDDIYGVVEKDSHYAHQTINHMRTGINCRSSYFRFQFHFAKYLWGKQWGLRFV